MLSPMFNRSARRQHMKKNIWLGLLALVCAAPVTSAPATAQQQRPNIVVVMGDDIGWFNIGAYHQGIMAGRTPNLDKLAAEGMRFTDYYAEASCTAGRANFITDAMGRAAMTSHRSADY
jgi:Sulfatase